MSRKLVFRIVITFILLALPSTAGAENFVMKNISSPTATQPKMFEVRADNRTLQKKAIIVAGRKSYDDPLWNETWLCVTEAYLALVFQGYTRDNIYFLSPETNFDGDRDGLFNDMDGDATKTNLSHAITEWAKDADELLLYMTGHGGRGTFLLNEEELLGADELDGWLDGLQETMSGRVIFIYDSVMSGSFIPILTPPDGKERILITSTAADEHAYFLNGGVFSFSYQFWASMLQVEANLYRAFDSARYMMDDHQTAWLDADGDGIGYLDAEMDVPVSDKLRIKDISIGRGMQSFSSPDITKKKKAIVVGNISDNYIWDQTWLCATKAYLALVWQGYTRDSIYFLSPETDFDGDGDGLSNDVDGDATKTNLSHAITEWAKDADELLLYMVDHGGNETFSLNEEEVLGADELNGWLDNLQEIMPGRVIFIYEATMAGSFIPILTPPDGKERILITSSTSDEPSYLLHNGILSFSYQFWTYLFRDASLYEAFNAARDMMEEYQTAWLDADGDGIGWDEEKRDIPVSDKQRAQEIVIGREFQKKAIIVAGRTSPNDYLWDETWLCVTEAYLALIYQGYTRDRIHFLSPENNFDGDEDGFFNDVDGEATKENLSYAITDWAKDADEVLIYMTDHGGRETFYLNESEILRAQGRTPEDPGLNEWLNQLQETMPGKVILIYDACKSGSFIPLLKPPPGKERILITSSAPDEDAFFLKSGILSFSYQFWAYLFRDGNLYHAFDLARVMMQGEQTAHLDANGDGIGYLRDEMDVDRNDKLVIEDMVIGEGRTAAPNPPPVIRTVSVDRPDLDGETSALIRAGDIVASDIGKVWALIIPPGYHPNLQDQPITELPSIDLEDPEGDGTYEGVYEDFTVNGTFKIIVHAEDIEGTYSLPALTAVRQSGIPETKGDLDADKKLTLKDLITALKLAAGDTLTIPVSHLDADADGDKRIGLEEAVYILERISWFVN